MYLARSDRELFGWLRHLLAVFLVFVGRGFAAVCGVVGRTHSSVRRMRTLRVVLLLALVTPVYGQDDPNAELAQLVTVWEATADRAQVLLENTDASAPALEALRGSLAEQRSDALEFQVAAGKRVAALNRQLLALGPLPEEGSSEAPEIALQRKDLKAQIDVVRVPVVTADAAYRRADGLIADLDSLMREQFTRRLISVGPSPLIPSYWSQPLADLTNVGARIAKEIRGNMASMRQRNALVQRLPVVLLLVIAGVALVLAARRWILRWVEETMRHDPNQRQAFWLAAALNVTRLLFPALGVAALLWAVQLSDLAGATGRGIIELLPWIAMVLIASSWVGNSVFSPNLPKQRLLEVDDAGARLGRRLAIALGVVLAMSMLLDLLARQSKMTSESLAVLNLPLIAVGALCLFKLSGLLRPKAVVVSEGEEGGRGEVLADSLLLTLSRVLLAVAIAAPIFSLTGYFAASRYLTFPPILSLGLLGGAVTIYALIREGIGSLGAGSAETRPGLLPVLAGFVLICLSLPILALIWGARTADISEIWFWLRDGVTIGGSRISLTDFLTFVLVFGAGYTITRLVQKITRTTVLPRTNLDVGGRNALLTGIGYTGYFLAAVLAISATGLDLSNLAIVAGALSVGVGFGLQAIVSNFVSGIILLVERPIKDGDWIEVTGFSGYVRKISVRSTRIETFDKASVIVPNSELISKTVLNWTHSGVSGRIRLPVKVGATAQPREVEAAFLKIVAAHPMVMRNPAPQVLLMRIGDPNEYEIRAHVRNITFMPAVISDLNYEIVRVLANPELVPAPPDPGIRLSNAEEVLAALVKSAGPA